MNVIDKGNKFFMTRHVQSDHNVGSWISADEETDKKSKITPLGLEQGHRLGKQLKEIGIDVIYRSPFQRVAQTCDIFCQYVTAPVFIDKRLRQFDCGVFNGKTWKERDAFFKNDFEKLTKRPTGGENFLDLKERMLAAFFDVNNSHKNNRILIVSHGNPLRILQVAALNLPDEAIFTDQRALKWKSDVSPEPEIGELIIEYARA